MYKVNNYVQTVLGWGVTQRLRIAKESKDL